MALPSPRKRLFLEPYGPAAFARLSGLIALLKDNEPLAPVTVVVPTQYAKLSLRRQLAAQSGMANVRFEIPARLVELLGAPGLAARGKSPLSRAADLTAIRATASQLPSGGPLGQVANHPRLHESLRATFRDMRRLSADELTSLRNSDPLRRELDEWFSLYRGHLQDLYDREELALSAADSVAGGRATAVLRDVGFALFFLVHDLSPGERDLLKALAAHGVCAAVLGLTGDEEADKAPLELSSRLEPSLGVANADSIAEPTTADNRHVVSAPDAHEEVRWIVRHIAQQAEAGTPFHRLAVLYRQADPYAHIVSGQLSMAGIPAAGPDPTPLGDTPAGKLLTLFQLVIEEDFSRDSVLQLIAEAPVGGLDDGTPASAELVRWEIASRSAGIVRGIDQWAERLDAYISRIGHEIEAEAEREETTPGRLAGLRDLAASAGLLNEFVKKLQADASPPPTGGLESLADWTKQTLDSYAHDVDSWPEEHRESYQAIKDKLDEIAALSPSFPGAELADFNALLNDALRSSSGRLGLFGQGVFVGPVGAGQGTDFDTVYVVGMAEGAFPAGSSDNALLPDRVRRGIDVAGVLPLGDARRADERRLYLAALTSGGSAVLSYPRADASGQRGQFPSPWLLEAAERLHGAPVSSADLTRHSSEEWLSVVESAQDGLRYASDLTAADTHDWNLRSMDLWKSAGRAPRDHFLVSKGALLRAFNMGRARSSTSFTEWDGRVSGDGTAGRHLSLKGPQEMSPTGLAQWAACPFQYFLGHVLRLSVLESPDDILTIDARDRGTLVHRILERFVVRATAGGTLPKHGEPWDSDHSALLGTIADGEFQVVESRGITGRRVLWASVKDEIREDLERFLEEDSRWRATGGWQPVATEHRFGFGRDDGKPAVVLNLPNGPTIRFRGLVDRIDVDSSGTAATVIDYKTGSWDPYRDMAKDPLDGGRQFQLPIYAMAVRAASDMPEKVNGFYWFVSTRGGFRRTKVELSEVEDRMGEVLSIVIDGIRSGTFPANPGSGRQQGWANCANCDFDRVCPSNRDRLWALKRGSPELAGYVGLSQSQEGLG